nr:MAG TPA_asm: Transcriptional regulatory protein RcsB factor, DNA BINDING PROTEIN.6A [Caudoviricetes sp.]
MPCLRLKILNLAAELGRDGRILTRHKGTLLHKLGLQSQPFSDMRPEQ